MKVVYRSNVSYTGIMPEKLMSKQRAQGPNKSEVEVTMDLVGYFQHELDAHAETTVRTRETLLEPFMHLVQLTLSTLRRGGKLILFGNGGSAADAQHIATELTVRYSQFRDPIAAVAISTDTSALTAIGNDYGFDQIFCRQVVAIARPPDLVLGISTSGKSANVTLALQVAQSKGLRTAAFTGRDGGDLIGLAEPLLIVPSHNTARIQEMHIILGHMLCGAIEQQLSLI